jgi:hypothetical protein
MTRTTRRKPSPHRVDRERRDPDRSDPSWEPRRRRADSALIDDGDLDEPEIPGT